MKWMPPGGRWCCLHVTPPGGRWCCLHVTPPGGRWCLHVMPPGGRWCCVHVMPPGGIWCCLHVTPPGGRWCCLHVILSLQADQLAIMVHRIFTVQHARLRSLKEIDNPSSSMQWFFVCLMLTNTINYTLEFYQHFSN
jgi:hypothetical protein